MQDKTMAANARKILLLTASAFCLSSAGAYLGTEVFKTGAERGMEERTQSMADDDGHAAPRPSLIR